MLAQFLPLTGAAGRARFKQLGIACTDDFIKRTLYFGSSLRNELKYALIAFAAGISGAVITGLPSYLDLTRQDEEINEMKRQADLMQQELEKQEERNRIQEAELQEIRSQTELMRQELKRESDIRIIVDPQGNKWEELSATLVIREDNGMVVSEFQDVSTSMRELAFIKDEHAVFSISIANVGSSIARIDHISAVVVPEEQNDVLGIIQLEDLSIKENMAPDANPREFEYSFLVEEQFAPSGIIRFTVHHISDKQYETDYPDLPYIYYDRNPFG